jgi:hypothetical protein
MTGKVTITDPLDYQVTDNGKFVTLKFSSGEGYFLEVMICYKV